MSDSNIIHVPLAPRALLQRAIDAGAALDVIERLIAWDERLERLERRRAFDAAMTKAKAKLPAIFKDKGSGYKYEDLGEMLRLIDPVLAEYDLYVRFAVSNNAKEVMVTCYVTHIDGYYIENTIAGPGDLSQRNPLQAIGSAITYFQRYSLKPLLGVAASMDTDAKDINGSTSLSAEQQQELDTLISEYESLRPGGKQRFFTWTAETKPSFEVSRAELLKQLKQARKDAAAH